MGLPHVPSVTAGGPPPSNRYSHLSANADELQSWWETFQAFDRDGGGDVDLVELGLMFRQLGQRPTEREMKDMIDAVDFDGSGTIDFEEFCLTMLRQQRAAITPAWLSGLFVPQPEAGDEEEDEEDEEGEPGGGRRPAAAIPLEKMPPPPEVVVLRGGALGLHGGREIVSRGLSSRALPDSSPTPGVGLSRDLLLACSDLLPNAKNLRHLDLSGHGPMMGPFVATEFGRALQKSNRSVTHLDLSNDNLQDDGAEAVAGAVAANPSLTSLNLSNNAIGGRGGTALLRALRAAPKVEGTAAGPAGAEKPTTATADQSGATTAVTAVGCGLRELKIDGNLLSTELHTAIQQQLLLNNLPRLFRAGLTAAPRPPPRQPSRRGKSGRMPTTPAARANQYLTIHETLQPGASHMPCDPAATLSQPWLGEGHAAALLVELLGASVVSFTLSSCPRLGGSGVASLLSTAMPPPSPLSKLIELRVSQCDVDDLALGALARSINAGSISAIRTLALDRNRLTFKTPLRLADTNGMQAPPASAAKGASDAEAIAAALCGLPDLTELDLSTNPMDDVAAAKLCATLLGASGALTLRTLHLGATGAGNMAARTCGERLIENAAALQLKALCLSSAVGDEGAARIAEALPYATSLRELWLGDALSDAGAACLLDAIAKPAVPEEGRPRCELTTLALGGEAQSGVYIRNAGLSAATAARVGELTKTTCALTDVRLSGNPQIGGEACIRLMMALQTTVPPPKHKRDITFPEPCRLRKLHVDDCGLTREELPKFLAALDPVWCLHELRVDKADIDLPLSAPVSNNATPRGARGGLFGVADRAEQERAALKIQATKRGADARRMVSQKKLGADAFSKGKGGGGRLMTINQRLSVAKLLEDNKLKGPLRVEKWRMSQSLNEVAWVFSSLCNGMDQDRIDRGLASWRGGECARFVLNLGLGQYTDTFAFNLRGTTLPHIHISQLTHLGVRNASHQKMIMEGVRQLVEAFSRRERHMKANENWEQLLKHAANRDDDEDTESNLSELPPVYHTPAAAPRRRLAGSHGRVVVGGGRDSDLGKYSQPEMLPINLHLPRIAAMHAQQSDRANQPKARGLYAAKPSVIPPASQKGQPPGLGGAGLGAAAAVEKTEWKELAKSYGLHLLPENGPHMHDHLNAPIHAPQPPEPRYAHIAGQINDPAANRGRPGQVPGLNMGIDLSVSPSLPMLSPGRVGVRNWVTFLHG